MAFDWRDFLVIAHSVASTGSEAAARTAVGRAYYYVFNACLLEARSSGFQGNLPGLHKKLWEWLQQRPEIEFREIGVVGSRLYAQRIQVDYQDSKFPVSAAGRALKRARRCEEALARRAGQQPPPALP